MFKKNKPERREKTSKERMREIVADEFQVSEIEFDARCPQRVFVSVYSKRLNLHMRGWEVFLSVSCDYLKPD